MSPRRRVPVIEYTNGPFGIIHTYPCRPCKGRGYYWWGWMCRHCGGCGEVEE